MRRVLSYVLVIAGILILLYPKASEWYDNKQQQKMLEEWEASSFDETAQQHAQQQYEQLTDLFIEEAGNSEPLASEESENSDSMVAEAAPRSTPEEVTTESRAAAIATIRIDKINLKLPVVEGATQKNMKSATAHLSETAKLGQVGNAAIAGHRMRAKGRLFNRLGEMEVGDTIVVETKEQQYTYTVYKVSIVDPTDVSVLNYNNTDKLLTLITCDPIVDPTHRLIVHAKMQG